MSNNPNEKTEQLVAESGGEEVNQSSPLQPDAPPPYEAIASTSFTNPGVSGPIFMPNSAPLPGQPTPVMYYPPFQHPAGQMVFPGGVYSVPPTQHIYIMPGATLPANSSQPAPSSTHPWNSNPPFAPTAPLESNDQPSNSKEYEASQSTTIELTDMKTSDYSSTDLPSSSQPSNYKYETAQTLHVEVKSKGINACISSSNERSAISDQLLMQNRYKTAPSQPRTQPTTKPASTRRRNVECQPFHQSPEENCRTRYICCCTVTVVLGFWLLIIWALTSTR